MSTDSVGGISSSLGQAAGISDKESFGAAVVTATLDKLNSGAASAANSDYDFQKTVLGGHAAGLGLVTDVKV